MKKELTLKAVELTERVLRDFHQKNTETVFSLCTPDMTWIGAQKGQFDIGLKVFRDDLERVVADMYPCHLANQEFLVTQNEGKTCTVIGRYLVISDEDSPGALAGEQRCVFVYQLIDGELRIRHISTTSPIGEVMVSGNENFVRSLGVTLKQYIAYQVEKRDRRVMVTDEEGVLHVMPESRILYIQASRKQCSIMLESGEMTIRETITQMKEKTSEDFVLIHRSYLINIHHVKRIQRDEAVMDDGTEIRFPEKRRAELKALLKDRFR